MIKKSILAMTVLILIVSISSISFKYEKVNDTVAYLNEQKLNYEYNDEDDNYNNKQVFKVDNTLYEDLKSAITALPPAGGVIYITRNVGIPADVAYKINVDKEFTIASEPNDRNVKFSFFRPHQGTYTNIFNIEGDTKITFKDIVIDLNRVKNGTDVTTPIDGTVFYADDNSVVKIENVEYKNSESSRTSMLVYAMKNSKVEVNNVVVDGVGGFQDFFRSNSDDATVSVGNISFKNNTLETKPEDDEKKGLISALRGTTIITGDITSENNKAKETNEDLPMIYIDKDKKVQIRANLTKPLTIKIPEGEDISNYIDATGYEESINHIYNFDNPNQRLAVKDGKIIWSEFTYEITKNPTVTLEGEVKWISSENPDHFYTEALPKLSLDDYTLETYNSKIETENVNISYSLKESKNGKVIINYELSDFNNNQYTKTISTAPTSNTAGLATLTNNEFPGVKLEINLPNISLDQYNLSITKRPTYISTGEVVFSYKNYTNVKVSVELAEINDSNYNKTEISNGYAYIHLEYEFIVFEYTIEAPESIGSRLVVFKDRGLKYLLSEEKVTPLDADQRWKGFSYDGLAPQTQYHIYIKSILENENHDIYYAGIITTTRTSTDELLDELHASIPNENLVVKNLSLSLIDAFKLEIEQLELETERQSLKDLYISKIKYTVKQVLAINDLTQFIYDLTGRTDLETELEKIVNDNVSKIKVLFSDDKVNEVLESGKTDLQTYVEIAMIHTKNNIKTALEEKYKDEMNSDIETILETFINTINEKNYHEHDTLLVLGNEEILKYIKQEQIKLINEKVNENTSEGVKKIIEEYIKKIEEASDKDEILELNDELEVKVDIQIKKEEIRKKLEEEFGGNPTEEQTKIIDKIVNGIDEKNYNDPEIVEKSLENGKKENAKLSEDNPTIKIISWVAISIFTLLIGLQIALIIKAKKGAK
ncbi:hypothetical protein BN85406480 [Alteracholeplasma palmae J233]|uniref:Uncharacterized protein n=1 Tax=Alteracholeplasma palmae (strain ATCC 49389 / J233) TaxID=1318466 RepID=U4KPM9_ALTPJ|nr:hypothetical protein [Alteracholeplasma palmae]CCV64225.1 hypothetical protein BN85406480 [Alteracholeplasma palmae J233]